MLIARKDNKIILYNHSDKIVESYILINATADEYTELLGSSSSWNKCPEGLYIEYNEKTAAASIYNKIALNHNVYNISTRNISKNYVSEVPGTAVLVRLNKDGLIQISYRKNNKCNLNRICISDQTKRNFFKSCRAGKYYKETGKYAICREDTELYNYWGGVMNDIYNYSIKNCRVVESKKR